MNYTDFLDRKAQLGTAAGFEPLWVPDFLFDFQRHLVEWAVRKGRAAIWADCGLGKTPMQLVWAENVVRKTNKPVLILTPLAVASQTKREAEKFGIDAHRSAKGELGKRITITNYERLDQFNAEDFAGVVCDESSILKSFNGETRKQVTRFMSKMPYRLLCTATAAPNDYVELGTSAEALGELSHSEMLKRFFKYLDDKGQKSELTKQEEAESAIKQMGGEYYQKLAYRVAQTIGQWRLKHHAVVPFWKWVASWARACRKPSDLGFDDSKFVLPPLNVYDHIIKPNTPPPGMLFNVPAFGLGAEREERRRTMTERCEFVRDLVDHNGPAIIWCHMNEEGDTIERDIPGAIQVAGRHSAEWKVAATEWFCGNLCRCQLNAIGTRGKLSTCQHEKRDTGSSGMRTIEKSESRSLLSTPSGTETNGSGILLPTTKPISTNTNSLPLPRNGKTSSGEDGTGPIPFTANGTKRRSKSGKPQTHGSGSNNGCVGTGLPPTTLTISPRSSGDDVQSAASTNPTSVAADFTLTTATQQCGCEDSCAGTAIRGSESSETTSFDSGGRCSICGNTREQHRVLISKAKIYGFGLNLQFCNHVVTFASHSYEQYYQSIRRCYRFGQKKPVRLDVVSTEGEIRVMANMRAKSERAERMFEALVREMNGAMRVERTNDYTTKEEVPAWLSKSNQSQTTTRSTAAIA